MSSIYGACYNHEYVSRDSDGNEYHWMYADEVSFDGVNVDLDYQ